MKRFALPLKFPILAVLAVGLACTDSTSPNPHSKLVPKNAIHIVQGNEPPPPTITAIEVTVNSPTLTAVFTGVYFANPSVESAAAANEVGDLSLLSAAWLRLDNKQTGVNSVSANARFQLTDQKSTGHGTLFISDGVVTHTVVIGAVTWDFANPDCNAAFEVCAIIRFDATVDGEPGHSGTAEAFGCEIVEGSPFCPIGS